MKKLLIIIYSMMFIMLALSVWFHYAARSLNREEHALKSDMDSRVVPYVPSRNTVEKYADSLGNWEIRASDDGYVWKCVDTGIGGDTVPMAFYSDFVRKHSCHYYQLHKKPIYDNMRHFINSYVNPKPVH